MWKTTEITLQWIVPRGRKRTILQLKHGNTT